MKKLCFLALFFAACIGYTADEEATVTPPSQVVRELIQAAKTNDLNNFAKRLDCSEVAMGPHGRSLADAIAFLSSIDLSTTEILGTSTPLTLPAEDERVILRTPDYKVRFDLKLRKSESKLGVSAYSQHEVTALPHYVVIEIHQHP